MAPDLVLLPQLARRLAEVAAIRGAAIGITKIENNVWELNDGVETWRVDALGQMLPAKEDQRAYLMRFLRAAANQADRVSGFDSDTGLLLANGERLREAADLLEQCCKEHK